jgi:hypothetical protein
LGVIVGKQIELAGQLHSLKLVPSRFHIYVHDAKVAHV